MKVIIDNPAYSYAEILKRPVEQNTEIKRRKGKRDY